MGRNVIIQVIVSKEEREQIVAASDRAKARGSQSLSSYCREQILARVENDKTLYNEKE